MLRRSKELPVLATRLPLASFIVGRTAKKIDALYSVHHPKREAMAAKKTSLIAFFTDTSPLRSAELIKAVKATPALAAEVDAKTGNTPLHFSCCNGAPLAVVKALLAANAEAAKVTDADGNLAIVGAVANGCGADVVKLLLDSHSESIRVRQGKHTLLHSAVSNGQTVEVVQLLLKAWPGAASERDEEGNAPLHFACGCQASPAVVKALLVACPEAAQWRGQMQRYPLSLCLLCESPAESVRAVRDAYPDAQRATEIVADYQNHGLGLGFKSQSGAPPY